MFIAQVDIAMTIKKTIYCAALTEWCDCAESSNIWCVTVADMVSDLLRNVWRRPIKIKSVVHDCTESRPFTHGVVQWNFIGPTIYFYCYLTLLQVFIPCVLSKCLEIMFFGPAVYWVSSFLILLMLASTAVRHVTASISHILGKKHYWHNF